MSVVSPERIRRDIVSLVHRGFGVDDFALAAARALRRAVPFDGVCVVTLDPATLLVTGHVIENGLPDAAMPRYTEIEILEADFNKFTALARAGSPAASLSAATGGDLDRSVRHRELRRPHGFGGDELRSAFVSESGTWGGLVLLRETGRAEFTHEDTQLVASLSTHLAEGLRRSILFAELSADSEDDQASAPGLLVLAGDNSIELANPAARMWLAELRADRLPDERLPSVIQAVADRARSIAFGDSDGNTVARVRLRTATGRWLLARGSMLGDGPEARAAVVLESLRSPELAPLIADAHGLTARERAVTQLVAQGLSTNEIAGRLYLSPYTVQDHLKAIFEKVGVSARGELVARLFFDHYAPRLTG